MRKQLAVCLMEDRDGISVQLFEDATKAQVAFDELTGTQSAMFTLVCLDYVTGQCSMKIKDLPCAGKQYTAYKIGDGPIDEADG